MAEMTHDCSWNNSTGLVLRWPSRCPPRSRPSCYQGWPDAPQSHRGLVLLQHACVQDDMLTGQVPVVHAALHAFVFFVNYNPVC